MFLLLASVALAGPPSLPDSAAFDGFVKASKVGSTALFIEQDGRVLVDWHRGPERPAKLMSITKSIVAVLLGMLLEDGRIASVELPISTWFPEVAGLPVGAVTLGELLTMTSGLAPCEDTSDAVGCAGFGPDRVAFALHSEMVQERGTWEYNNNVINLVSGVIQRVTGHPMDEYAAAALFAPLGITSAEWGRDQVGATAAESGLSMSAHDLARIGKLMLAGGVWEGKRLISTETLSKLTRPLEAYPWFAQLWWPVYRPHVKLSSALFDYWHATGIDDDTLASLRPLVGTSWPSAELAVQDEVEALGGGTLGRERFNGLAFRTVATVDVAAGLSGYAAKGYLGQYLVVLPGSRVVAVRQRAVGRIFQEYEDDKRDLPGWPARVAALFGK